VRAAGARCTGSRPPGTARRRRTRPPRGPSDRRRRGVRLGAGVVEVPSSHRPRQAGVKLVRDFKRVSAVGVRRRARGHGPGRGGDRCRLAVFSPWRGRPHAADGIRPVRHRAEPASSAMRRAIADPASLIESGKEGYEIAGRGFHRFGRRPLVECPAAGQHLVEHDSEGEEIGAMVRRGAAHLLRRHVPDRAEESARRRLRRTRRGGGVLRQETVEALGEPEVQDLHGPLTRDENVLGLQVAVHDPLVVDRRQRPREVARPFQRLRPRNGAPLEALPKRLPFDQLGHDERRGAVHADVVNGHDVRMGQRGDGPRLARESRERAGVVRQLLGEDLHGHVAPEAVVPRAIHRGCAAPAERRHYPVGPQAVSGREAHRRLRSGWSRSAMPAAYCTARSRRASVGPPDRLA